MGRFTQRQRSIIVGTILGDGYLQPTSKHAARLRIEQSAKQKFYAQWKYEQFQQVMQGKPVSLTRFNPYYQRTYQYMRCQTVALPELGWFREQFYTQRGLKRVPANIQTLLTPLALAIWYMDDGYFYRRDSAAYIYLSNLSAQSIARIRRALALRYDLHPHLYQKKLGKCFYFPVAETKKLLKTVKSFILPQFQYKVLV